MYNTYAAVLRGEKLEWRSEKPARLTEDRAINVHITILEETPTAKTASDQGQRMAAALEELAQITASNLPTDPMAWERETREDRTLPGRE